MLKRSAVVFSALIIALAVVSGVVYAAGSHTDWIKLGGGADADNNTIEFEASGNLVAAGDLVASGENVGLMATDETGGVIALIGSDAVITAGEGLVKTEADTVHLEAHLGEGEETMFLYMGEVDTYLPEWFKETSLLTAYDCVVGAYVDLETLAAALTLEQTGTATMSNEAGAQVILEPGGDVRIILGAS